MKNQGFYKKKGLYYSVIEATEKPLITGTLETTYGNQLKAAKILGINRNTLRSKIRKLGIEVKR
jgi:two-component system, NtrC family, nitrogen regulation response regulator GlnG